MTQKGDAITVDTRGISNLVGVVLLIGMAVSGAVLIVVLGSGALEETEKQGRLKTAEQGLQEVSSRLQELRVGGGQMETSFTLPQNAKGDIQIQETTTVELIANDNEGWSRDCTSGAVDIGTITYENNDGDVVGYEAGGVWRSSPGGGSWMVSAPDVAYQNGRLEMSVSQIGGSIGSGTVSARMDERATQRMNRNMTRALFSDQTATELSEGIVETHSSCDLNPANLSRISVHIDGSRFASAWRSYALRNFDERRVVVRPERSTPITAGETVNITFLIGDTAGPEFRLDDVEAPSSARDDSTITVSANVTNVGDLQGTREVGLTLVNHTASPNETVGSVPLARGEVTLGGGERTSVSFTVDDFEDIPPNRKYVNYTLNLDTGDNVHNESILVGDGTPAHFEVTDVDAPTGVDIGESFDVEVEITNTGGMLATETVQYWFGDADSPTEVRQVADLRGGDSQTVTFSDTVFDSGTFPINVSIRNPEDGSQYDDSRTIDIGDNPNYQIDGTTAPASVSANTAFSVNATVRNAGEIDGDGDQFPIEVLVRNQTTNSVVKEETYDRDLAGTFTVTDGEVGTVNMTVSSGISTPGRYEYRVSTPNETRTGNIFVGGVSAPNFIVAQASPVDVPVEQGGTLSLEATVENTGTETGAQDVSYYFDGSLISVETNVELDPGESRDLPLVTQNIPESTETGWHDYRVETENTTLSGQVRVVENLSDANFGSGDTTLEFNTSITAELTVLGTELSGIRYNYWGYPYGIGRGPISMAIYTDNATAPNQYHYVWGENTDLNSPQRRRDQIEGDAYLSQTISVTATEDNPTNVSVFAKSYYCYDERPTSISSAVDGLSRNLTQYLCTDQSYNPRIAINQENNPSNLVILEDGDRVPAYGQASPEQRDVREILGDMISTNGYLDIDANQRVLMYELSKEEADPDNAREDNEDPDYNDAVVLFEKVNETNSASVTSDPDIRINDTEGPAQVTRTNNAEFLVDLWNRGRTDGEDYLELWVDGTQYQNESVSVDSGESTSEALDIPDGLSTGQHEIAFKLSSDPANKTVERNLYVGTSPKPYFQLNPNSHTAYVRPGEEISIDTVVTNVGNQGDTQDVTAEVTSVSDSSLSGLSGESETKTTTLNPDQETVETFEISTTAGNEGTATVTVSTPENGSFAVDVVVRDPKFNINQTFVGDRTFEDGDTIVAGNLERLGASITNPVPIEETQDVTFRLDHDSDGTLEAVDTQTLTLSDETALPRFELGSYSNQTGTYSYSIVPEDGTRLSGEIQIVETTPSNTLNDRDDPEQVAVNVNVVQLN